MMDVNARTLMKVEIELIEDAAMADDIFSMRMGEKVQPCKEFIERHAKDMIAEDIDV